MKNQLKQITNVEELVGKRVTWVKSPTGFFYDFAMVIGFDDDSFVIIGIEKQWESCDDFVTVVEDTEYFNTKEIQDMLNGNCRY